MAAKKRTSQRQPTQRAPRKKRAARSSRASTESTKASESSKKSTRGKGRPSKWQDEFLEQAVYQVDTYGATQEQLAAFFKVDISTLERWLKEKDDFRGAIKDARDRHDTRVVERSLLERAVGFEAKETKAFVIDGQIVTKDVIKHYPPDATSLIFFLKNRNPERWRDKQDLEITGDLGERIRAAKKRVGK